MDPGQIVWEINYSTHLGKKINFQIYTILIFHFADMERYGSHYSHSVGSISTKPFDKYFSMVKYRILLFSDLPKIGTFMSVWIFC